MLFDRARGQTPIDPGSSFARHPPPSTTSDYRQEFRRQEPTSSSGGSRPARDNRSLQPSLISAYRRSSATVEASLRQSPASRGSRSLTRRRLFCLSHARRSLAARDLTASPPPAAGGGGARGCRPCKNSGQALTQCDCCDSVPTGGPRGSSSFTRTGRPSAETRSLSPGNQAMFASRGRVQAELISINAQGRVNAKVRGRL
jgi:hypothetical protein